ncbi:hypothetical protein ABFP60_15940 [Clostridioides difficile]
MKKRGSVLATVLITAMVLLILGTAVSAGVINTTKLNKKYSENIDLELAAKSGLNIVLDDFLKVAITEDAINNYTVNRSTIDSIYNESSGIEVNVNLQRVNNQITITSEAKDRSNTSNVKVETKIININGVSNPGGSTDTSEPNGELKPISFINVKRNVYLGWSDLSVIDSISYGGVVERKNYTLEQNPNPELKKNDIKMNTNKISEVLNGLEVQEYIPDYNAFRKINGNEIIAGITNIENDKLIVNGDINFNSNGDKKIIIKDSVVILNDSLISNNKVEIILENSRLIVEKDIKINNESKISLVNSTIEVKGESQTSSRATIQLNNSKYYVDKNLKSSTKIIMILDLNSILCVKGNLSCPETMECTVNNKSSVIIKGDMTSSSTGFDISLNDESIMIVNQINAPNKTKFNLSKSILISNVIYSSTDVIIQLRESVAFVTEKVFSNSEFNTRLNNSVLIILGLLNPVYNAKIINEGKSYIFCSGDFNTDNVIILGGGNSIIPDSQFVIKIINDFITNGK